MSTEVMSHHLNRSLNVFEYRRRCWDHVNPFTGTLHITTDGAVISGLDIRGGIIIDADNVVIKNCKITFGGYWGVDAEGAKNVTIQDCDIIGPGYSFTSNSAILGSGNFLRNDISKVENGITLQGGASVVKGNYIHDLQAPGVIPTMTAYRSTAAKTAF